MQDTDTELGFVDPGYLDEAWRFAHEAMSTTFEVYIFGENRAYAGEVSREGFELVDRIEQEISRFIGNSDTARIRALDTESSLVVGPEMFRCLEQCLQLHSETEGAFDIAVGPLYQCWINHESKSLRAPSEGAVDAARQRSGLRDLSLDPETHRVSVDRSPLELDFGGFGKGYALDRMGELFREWGVESALLSAGGSTILTLGVPPDLEGWPFTVSDYRESGGVLGRFHLVDQAISGSGVRKGEHIIDPGGGVPASGTFAAWAITQQAARADALSTAFFIMDEADIRRFVKTHEGTRALILQETGDHKEAFRQFV